MSHHIFLISMIFTSFDTQYFLFQGKQIFSVKRTNFRNLFSSNKSSKKSLDNIFPKINFAFFCPLGLRVLVGLGLALCLGLSVELGVVVGLRIAVDLGMAVGLGMAIGLGVAVDLEWR